LSSYVAIFRQLDDLRRANRLVWDFKNDATIVLANGPKLRDKLSICVTYGLSEISNTLYRFINISSTLVDELDHD
jgi:hypothetical protein